MAADGLITLPAPDHADHSRTSETAPADGNSEYLRLIEDDLARWPALLADLADGGSAADLSAGALAFFARTYARAVVTAQYDAIFGLRPGSAEERDGLIVS